MGITRGLSRGSGVYRARSGGLQAQPLGDGRTTYCYIRTWTVTSLRGAVATTQPLYDILVPAIPGVHKYLDDAHELPRCLFSVSLVRACQPRIGRRQDSACACHHPHLSGTRQLHSPTCTDTPLKKLHPGWRDILPQHDIDVQPALGDGNAPPFPVCPLLLAMIMLGTGIMGWAMVAQVLLMGTVVEEAISG